MAYSRMSAIITAMNFADRVSLDGFVASKLGYFGQSPAGHSKGLKTLNGVLITPGMLLSDIGAIPRENDCAHFISCCVGNTHGTLEVGQAKVSFRGGGLHLRSPFSPVYGPTHAGKLAGELVSHGAKIIHPQFMITTYESTRRAVQEKLTAGDVLIYASKDNHDSYEHSAILVGPTQICCHTTSRRALDFNNVSHPWVTLLKMP